LAPLPFPHPPGVDNIKDGYWLIPLADTFVVRSPPRGMLAAAWADGFHAGLRPERVVALQPSLVLGSPALVAPA
jgi:hypothetical protein